MEPLAARKEAGPQAGDAPDVFLSFSSVDRDAALRIEAAIEAMGLRCWSFVSDQAAGTYADHIAKAIDGCRIVVLILTQAASESEPVQREIALASERKRLIIPLREDPTIRPSAGLAFWIQGLHWPASIAELERVLAPHRPPAPAALAGTVVVPPVPHVGWRWWQFALLGLSLLGFLVVMSQVFCASGVARAGTTPPRPAPLLTDAELAVFKDRLLPRADPRAVDAALGPAAAVLRAKENLDPARFRTVSGGAAECMMQRAADRRLNVAQLFTDPRFGPGGGLAIVIDRGGIGEIDRVFDLHSLFPAAVTTTDGRAARMQFLLAGDGRLVVGYDRGGEIEHREPAYHLYTGRYELQPLIRMDLEVAARRAFTRIATLHRLDGAASYGDFVGPMDAKLRGLVIHPDGIAVQAKLPLYLLGLERDLRVQAPAIARRRALAPAEAADLRARGCPVDGPWAEAASP